MKTSRFKKKEEEQLLTLRKAIKEGIDSGVAKGFNPKQHLRFLKSKKSNC